MPERLKGGGRPKSVLSGRPEQASCPRCGVTRAVRSDRRKSLCRDCRSVLNKYELGVWAA